MSQTNKFIKNALYSGRTVKVEVTGKCMEPILKDKDELIVCSQNTYYIGDIVLFEDDRGKLISHRVNFINDHFFVSSGDNNRYYDIPRNNRSILGKIRDHSSQFRVPNIIQSITVDENLDLSNFCDYEISIIAILEDFNVEVFNKYKSIIEQPINKSKKMLLLYVLNPKILNKCSSYLNSIVFL